MDRTSPPVRFALGMGYGLAGALLFFAIIGVFGLHIAIGSLVFFIALTILSLFRTAGESSKA